MCVPWTVMQPEDVCQISRVNINGSKSGRYYYTSDNMTCVNVNFDIYHLKQIFPHRGVCHGKDRQWQWSLPKDADWCDLPLFSLHLSVPPVVCSWKMWQRASPNKVPPDGVSQDEVFGDGRRRKEVLLPQQEATSPVMDGPWRRNPLSSLLSALFPPSHPLFYHALSCLLALSWSDLCDVRSRVWTLYHCVILHS